MKKINFLKQLVVAGTLILSIPLTASAQTRADEGGASGNGDGDLAIAGAPVGLNRFEQAVYLWERSALPASNHFPQRAPSAGVVLYQTSSGPVVKEESVHIAGRLIDLGELGSEIEITIGARTYTPVQQGGSLVVQDWHFRATPAGKLIVATKAQDGVCGSRTSHQPVRGICEIYYFR